MTLLGIDEGTLVFVSVIIAAVMAIVALFSYLLQRKATRDQMRAANKNAKQLATVFGKVGEVSQSYEREIISLQKEIDVLQQKIDSPQSIRTLSPPADQGLAIQLENLEQRKREQSWREISGIAKAIGWLADRLPEDDEEYEDDDWEY